MPAVTIRFVSLLDKFDRLSRTASIRIGVRGSRASPGFSNAVPKR
jgi:hypothetical protein